MNNGRLNLILSFWVCFLLFSLPIQAVPQAQLAEPSASVSTQELAGVWRGTIEVQPGVYLTIGLSIEGQQLALDSPNQGMYGKIPTQFEVTSNSVSLVDRDLGAEYKAELKNGQLVGEFKQGKVFALNLFKLAPDDLERLAFEGAYLGKLMVNKQPLPLQINIAVLAGGYLGTLDSPRQQSYGIPLTEVQVSTHKLTFKSPLIQAAFEGERTDVEADFVGTFHQGQAFPLTLSKKGSDVAVHHDLPEFGTHNGAIALIQTSGVETKHFHKGDASTPYEIGSVTKTMVGYLLAESIAQKKLARHQKAQEIWSVVPEAITLEQLATHTSGLPRLPEDLFLEAEATNPYRHYSQEKLAYMLSQQVLGETQYEYSNYGFGLLAELLAKQAGLSFEQQLKQQLLKPAGMKNTWLSLPDSASLQAGFDALDEPVPSWQFDALAGAGAVVSNLDDMVAYVKFMMQGIKTSQPAHLVLVQPVFELDSYRNQALGWILQKDQQGKWLAWHNGQTAGYSSFVGFYLDGSRGLVLLNQQAVDYSAEALLLLMGVQSQFAQFGLSFDH